MKMRLKLNNKEKFGVGDIISTNLLDYYLIVEDYYNGTHPIKLLDLDDYRIEQEYQDIQEISDKFKIVCRAGRYTLVED